MVEHLPVKQETWVQSLGQEDPLEKEMATHSSSLAWRLPWMEEPSRLQFMGLQRVGHYWATSLSFLSFFNFLYSPTLTSIHNSGKAIAWTRRTFVSKVMSLLFNMLPRLIIAFLPRSKHLNFMAAVTICSDFGAQENKVCHCFHCFPIYLPWSDGTRCHDLSFLNVEF